MTKLTVSPLTRLEGHGKVDLILQDGHLVDARVCLTEAPRLFESIVTGHRFDEVPDLICRICSICSAVHKLTALKAVEQAMNVNIPPAAKMIRELLLLGGHIQSHALHLYLLILPDFSGEESIIPLLKKKHPLAVEGLSLKAFGNRLQEVMGGRVIHPVNPVFGGVSHRPEIEQLTKLAAQAEQWNQKWPYLSAGFLREAAYPGSVDACGTPLALNQDNGITLNGISLRYGHDHVMPVTEYAKLLEESKVAHSHAKVSGGKSGPFLTGALARRSLLPEKHCSKEDLQREHGIHDNNTAQIYEIGWALNRIIELLEELMASEKDGALKVSPVSPESGIGTAAIEAPRGLLIHHYVIDEWGLVVAADVVTPTAINQKAMAAQILADLEGEKDPKVLKTTTERIIRSYDPCISCAVHLLES